MSQRTLQLSDIELLGGVPAHPASRRANIEVMRNERELTI